MNILCFGDSNTWGYKPDKSGRYDENTRWTGLLQKKLGSGYHIIEEGLCGRTTVFQDELREGRRGLDLIGVTVEMHNPIDLMIIMLGTNDCKTRYRASASVIAKGLDQVIRKARQNASRHFDPERDTLSASGLFGKARPGITRNCGTRFPVGRLAENASHSRAK